MRIKYYQYSQINNFLKLGLFGINIKAFTINFQKYSFGLRVRRSNFMRSKFNFFQEIEFSIMRSKFLIIDSIS